MKRVALIGCRGEAELLARAYAQSAQAELIGVADPDAPDAARHVSEALSLKLYDDPERLIDAAQAVDVCLQPATALQWVERCIAARKPSRALYPCAEDPERLQAAAQHARSAGVTADVLYLPLYFPPLIQARKLLSREILGDVQTLRVRVTKGGSGGWWDNNAPKFERPRGGLLLNDQAFDLLPLALLLLGPFEHKHARLERPDSNGAGSSQLSWRYPGGRGHGLYEAIWAPNTLIKSWDEPISEELELAGTDGYLWLRRFRGMGQDRPTLETYVHDKLTAYGGERPIQWSAAYAAAIQRDHATPALTLAPAARALELFSKS